jgi:transposase
MAAAEATLRLWGCDGMDFDALAEDIAAEARGALALSDEIKRLDRRIAKLHQQADPTGIVRSAPGVGAVCAPQILGRLGDASRFANLAAIRHGVDPRYRGLDRRPAVPSVRGQHHRRAHLGGVGVLPLVRARAAARAQPRRCGPPPPLPH